MNQPDRSIETVLSALKTAQPATDLESRVLAALHRRTSVQPARHWERWSGLRTVAWAVSVAALFAIGWHFVGHRPQTLRTAPALVQAQPPAQPGTPVLRVLHHARTSPHVAANHPPIGTPPSISMDELAREEMRAPSQPAPPIPLTDQERLLLFAIRNGDTQELAELNSDVLHALEARDQRDFERFFRAPAPVSQPQQPLVEPVTAVPPSVDSTATEQTMTSPAQPGIQPDPADPSLTEPLATETPTQTDAPTTSNFDGR